MGSTRGAGSDPRSAQASAEVPPLPQDVLFHFPPASSAASACPVTRSQGWFISPFFPPGFCPEPPARQALLFSWFFFKKKSYFRFFFSIYQKLLKACLISHQSKFPHHAATATKMALSSLLVRPPFIPLTDKCSQQSQVLEYWGKTPLTASWR